MCCSKIINFILISNVSKTFGERSIPIIFLVVNMNNSFDEQFKHVNEKTQPF